VIRISCVGCSRFTVLLGGVLRGVRDFDVGDSFRVICVA